MTTRREVLKAFSLSAVALSGCFPSADPPTPAIFLPTSTLPPSPTPRPTPTETIVPSATPDLPQLDPSLSELDPIFIDAAYRNLVDLGYHSSTFVTSENGILVAYLNGQNFLFVDHHNQTHEYPTPPNTQLIYAHTTWSPWVFDQNSDFRTALLPTLVGDYHSVSHLTSQAELSFQSQLTPPVLHLTVDDGYYPDETFRILDLAATNSWKVTFFLNTNYLRVRQETQALVLQRILAEGHELGYHTSNHSRLGWGSADWLAQDVSDFENLVRSYTSISNYQAKAMRPPYGYFDYQWLLFSALTNRPTYLWTYYNADPVDPRVDLPNTLRVESRSAFILLHTRPECITWLNNYGDLLNSLIADGYSSQTVTDALINH